MLRSFLFGAIALAPGFLLLALRLWLVQRRPWPVGSTGRGPQIGIIVVAATVAAMASLAQARLAQAHDDGRYAQSPNRVWFRSLTNQYGIICCDEADGMRLDDPDWEFDGETYRVRVDGSWMPVPATAIVRQSNKMSYAVVWLWKDEGRLRVGCFMAGSAT
jgi:hypothetical protein